MNNSKRRNGRILGLLVFFILCFFASFFLGRYPITPKELIEVVASRILPIEKTWTSAVEHVIFQVRLPRVLLAALIGAGSVSYTHLVLQKVFRPSLTRLSGRIKKHLQNRQWLYQSYQYF